MGQVFATAYNTNQNCNTGSVLDPTTGAVRLVDHYIIDEFVMNDLATEIRTHISR